MAEIPGGQSFEYGDRKKAREIMAHSRPQTNEQGSGIVRPPPPGSQPFQNPVQTLLNRETPDPTGFAQQMQQIQPLDSYSQQEAQDLTFWEKIASMAAYSRSPGLRYMAARGLLDAVRNGKIRRAR